jgi:ribonuclease-3 family protein
MIQQFLRQLRNLIRGGNRTGSADRLPATTALLPSAPRRGARTPLALAYVGDAVYELYVRVHLVEQENLTRNFQPTATNLVRASTQSRILGALEPELTDEELTIVRQGRNANIGQIPKSASMIDYRRATALECLFGYLLLEGREERLMELLPIAIAEGRKPVDCPPALETRP